MCEGLGLDWEDQRRAYLENLNRLEKIIKKINELTMQADWNDLYECVWALKEIKGLTE